METDFFQVFIHFFNNQFNIARQFKCDPANKGRTDKDKSKDQSKNPVSTQFMILHKFIQYGSYDQNARQYGNIEGYNGQVFFYGIVMIYG